jgi:aldose 1-epimerase
MNHHVRSSNAQIKPEAFHRIISGAQVDLYTLKNLNGLEANITNYGGLVVSLTVPDKKWKTRRCGTRV